MEDLHELKFGKDLEKMRIADAVDGEDQTRVAFTVGLLEFPTPLAQIVRVGSCFHDESLARGGDEGQFAGGSLRSLNRNGHVVFQQCFLWDGDVEVRGGSVC